MEIITSKDNNKIKYLRALNSKKSRNSDHVFVAEGIKFVSESLKEKVSIKFVMISNDILDKEETNDLIETLRKEKIDFFICEESIFSSITDTINSQGILAVISKLENKKEEILTDYKFIVLCDRIQDPGNLGTIIRTSDAFGPAAVILNKGCVDVYNSKVVRATAGSMFRVPFIIGDETQEILEYLKKYEYKIISTVIRSELSFDDIEKSEKICLVIGNEGQGISWEIKEASDINITIKMDGRAESLNASIAAGICIYEIRKKLL
nr:RNA methyltransferase [Sedimentibacter sp.]